MAKDRREGGSRRGDVVSARWAFGIYVGVVLLALITSALPAHCITNGVQPASDDPRYDAVAAFAVSWRLGFDQGSHGDDADHNWFCSATLVNGTQVEVAKHCLTPYGDPSSTVTYMVRFRRATDNSIGTVTAGVSSFFHDRITSCWKHATLDVAICDLQDEVYHITSLPLSIETLHANEAVTQAGWGREGPAPGAGPYTRLLTCANSIVSIDPLDHVINVLNTFTTPSNDCGTNNVDSGGPVLTADLCGNLKVVASTSVNVQATTFVQSVIDQAPPSVNYRCDLESLTVKTASTKRRRLF